MEDIRLPRQVIDRLENRWATRLQQDAKAWSVKRGRWSGYAMCSPVREKSLSPSDMRRAADALRLE
jgi:hypothetical protein